MSEMNIVVPIIGPGIDTATADTEKVAGMENVAGIEIRYDMINSPDIPLVETTDFEYMMTRSEKPVIVSIMRQMEGGRFRASDDKKEDDEMWLEVYHKVLELCPTAVSVGADYDHLVAGPEHRPKEGTKLIWTYHNFKKTPKRLQDIYQRGIASPAKPDVIKLAAKANSYEDALRMLNLVANASRAGQDVIGLPMGKYGVWVRAVGCMLGNQLTFAALSPDKVSGPGQPTVKDLEDVITKLQMGSE